MNEQNNWLDSIRPLLAELERYALWVNSQYQLGLKDKVTILVQTKGTRAVYGHFRPVGWARGEAKVHEISIAAEELARPVLEVLGTVQHEMVHAGCNQAVVQDCAKSGRHNKRYQAAAVAAGLTCELMSKSRGYALTAMTEETKRLVEDAFQPDIAAFGLCRLVPAKKSTKAASQVAFICQTCGTKARAHRDTLLVCGHCTPEGHNRVDMLAQEV